jgi:ABC-type bacteriocin/lantibiotic exporter with double-glycine peptidase domain
MRSLFKYLKQGLTRTHSKDRIGGTSEPAGLRTNLKNLRPFFSRHWRKGLLGGFLIIFASLLGFPQPLITRYLIDHVILGRQIALLAGALLLLAGITLAEKLMNLLQTFYFSRFEQEVILDIQQDLLDRASRFPKSFFDANQTGYLMSRLSSDVQGLRWFFSGTVVYIFSNLLRFVGGVGFLFYLEWRLATGVVIILPGLIFCVRYFSRKTYILSHQSMEQHANVSSQFQESLSSVSLIKSFSSEMRTIGHLISELKKALQISLEQSTVGSVANLVITSMPGIARVLVLAIGAYWVIKGEWTLGSLLAFQAYLGYVFSPAQYLATANLDLQNARASLERVSALFDIVPEENIRSGKKVERLTGEIEFKDVSFSYDSREPVLNDLSFHIQPGEHVAIAGPTGVGKTTLLSLILRFYQPTRGEIYFDGQPASDYEVSSLRRRIGYVSQSTHLLSGTIMENLRYGNTDASDNEVFRAAKVADIHEFICSLPKGYESEVGERGVNLSEGQKQQLSIARALVKDPDILVLDEPASALDSLTEKSILQSLPSSIQNKTLFVVAHRFSTIKDSDRILLLNENRLIAIGTHQSLLETNDYYRSLVAYQHVCTDY